MSIVTLIESNGINDRDLVTRIKDKFLRFEGSINPPKQVPATNLFLKGTSDFINDIRITSVLWEKGKITIYPLYDSEDVVSFQFSGCIMAKFKYYNQYYVAHVHVTKDEEDTRKQWIDFIKNSLWVTEITMFKPNEGVYAYEIWGVITSNGDCYSIGFNCLGTRVIVKKHVSYGNSLSDYQELFSADYETWDNFWSRPYASNCRI